MHLVLLMYLLYTFAFIFRKYDTLCNWIEAKLKPNLIWRSAFTFLIESYFDFAVGIMLRLEQPKFETGSDYYDFSLACIFSVVMVGLPILSYIILKKN